MEAESKRKWDFFLMLYYVSQNNDLIESFILCHGEKTYKKSTNLTLKQNNRNKTEIIIIAPFLYHYFCTFLVLILSRRVSDDEKMESRVQSSSEKVSKDALE